MPLTFNADTHKYRLDRKAVPSVTGLIGKGLPKDALPYWSAKTVSEYVADNREAIEALWFMGREPMVQALKNIPWQLRNEAAVRGTDVHSIAERIVHGHQVDVPEHLLAHVRGYTDWLDEFAVTPILTEHSVGNRAHWYAGRFDLIASINGTTWLLDIKTSSSVYPETSLQLSAYAGAEFYVTDDDPDTELPLPTAERYGVVHVTEHGTTLVEMAHAWDEWLAVLAVAKARKAINGKALRDITTPEELETI